ncbi:HK97 family phage prohead protease [Ornithobacterium rhinotracheale]|uniref:HK97 family phage prohead protease n=1 Tax=Ornithobacterium rhinotracheale TaxID=28251 RepID=UPI001FF6CFD6|nr:HK97 family phage prohead protease [Ornithobacterium rhinotracheale]MCK0206213.1 HK97 family phage prohead protease [Ornithobacterium rhinotracheale]
MPRFILNDETKANSYGFKIKTSGIRLERFSANPVMLDGHNPSNLSVIGQWKEIKTEDGKLSADTDFDTEDTNAALIAGKVERGIIKGASMGIAFQKKDLRLENGELILSACELLEASIVSIPSNANALRLYVDNRLLTREEVQNLCLSIENNENFNPEHMKKLQLSTAALLILGFTVAQELDAEQINEAVLSLDKQKKDLEAKLQLSEEKVQAYERKAKEEKDKAITDMVSLAVKQGKITADKQQSFVELANQNFELAKSTLDAIPAKQNYSGAVNTPTGAVQTMDDFQKLSLTEQLAFKNGNPEAYSELLKTI